MSEMLGTPLQEVYDAFLRQVTADDWLSDESLLYAEKDWLSLLQGAIDRFERPNISLEIAPIPVTTPETTTPQNFIETLTEQEINLLSRYMKLEWLNRSVADWKQIKQLYSNRDFVRSRVA